MDATQTIDPIQDAAEKRLAELEAEDKSLEQAQTQTVPEAKPSTDRPVDDGKKVESAPNSQPKTGIPSEAEKEIEEAKKQAESEGKELDTDDKGQPKRDAQGKFVKRDKKSVEKIKLTPEEEKKFTDYYKQLTSSYTHNETKQMLRWEKIKEREAELESKTKTSAETLNKAVAKFNSDVATWKAEQNKARGAPEQYDKFAEKRETDYKLLEAEIIKAENVGDLEKAKELERQATIAKNDAEQAKKFAEALRKNPPPNDAQVQEQFKKDQATWIDKAGQEFPEFAKKDSLIRNGAVAYYQEMVKQHPTLAKLPGFIYFAVEHITLKSAADRVPAMEKELGELRTKVKEQDAMLNPAGPGSPVTPKAPKNFESMSDDEQYEALQREAAGIQVGTTR